MQAPSTMMVYVPLVRANMMAAYGDWGAIRLAQPRATYIYCHWHLTAVAPTRMETVARADLRANEAACGLLVTQPA